MAEFSCLVWVQTTTRRDNSKTLASIERSDIGKKYLVCEDRKERKFPQDYADLQLTWFKFWRDMLEAADVRKCEYILRLEDDVLVNEHILHNLATWPALNHPKFGFGTLFVPNYWYKHPQHYKRDPDEGSTYRNLIDIEGAQGQLVKVSTFPNILDGVQRAREQRGLGKHQHGPSFDWAVSRSAWQLGLRVFVPSPALVNIHEESLRSTIDEKQNAGGAPSLPNSHYWGDRAFSEDYRR
jgi:hypothetical protein